jgi:hypothetical protein
MCAEAWVLMAAFAIALRLAAPSRAIEAAARSRGRRAVHPAIVLRVAGAMERAAAWLPARLTTCLPRACAAQRMLGRRGVRSDLKLGVLRRPDGGLRAHAWIEADGWRIGHDADGPDFAPLPAPLARNA